MERSEVTLNFGGEKMKKSTERIIDSCIFTWIMAILLGLFLFSGCTSMPRDDEYMVQRNKNIQIINLQTFLIQLSNLHTSLNQQDIEESFNGLLESLDK